MTQPANNEQLPSKPGRSKLLKKILIGISMILCLAVTCLSVYVYSLLDLINYEPLPDDGPGDEPVPSVTPAGNTEGPGQAPSPEPTPVSTPRVIDKSGLSVSNDIPSPQAAGIMNILLFGLDTSVPGGPARSDALMIASIDRRNNQLKLTSLMRDMYVSIPGREDNRINTGYIFGGPALQIKTVNENLHMNIEHYIAVDFTGFKAIIDKLGGVEISVTSREAEIIGLESEGTYNLNGEQALIYSRIRKVGGDWARTNRQRTVLNALFKKSRTVSVFKLPELLAEILPHIRTNLNKVEILGIGKNLFDARNNEIEQLRLPAEGTYKGRMIRNMAVLVPDLETNIKLLHEFIYGEDFQKN